jgi:hypothetical protein
MIKLSLLQEESERVRPASTSSGSGRDLQVECDEEERSAHLGDKVKRLESLLAKCKVRFNLWLVNSPCYVIHWFKLPSHECLISGEYQGQQAEDCGAHRGEGTAGSPAADQGAGDPAAAGQE